MAEVVRELPGEPSHVLDSLAGRLASDGWKITTRSGPLLQAARNGRSLTLTVLGSAHGTRVHAQGSFDAVHYLRRAIAPESTSPKEFSFKGGRLNFGPAILSGLGLAFMAAGFIIVAALCQSPSSSNVNSSGNDDLALQADGVGQAPGQDTGQQMSPSATPAPPSPTPTQLRAVAPPPRRPSPTPVPPTATPQPPPPTATAIPARNTPYVSPTPAASPTVRPTATRPPRASPSPATPTPVLDFTGGHYKH